MQISGFLTAKLTRAVVGGAVLALGLIGAGLANADAATPATVQFSTNFICLSGCTADGVPVAKGDVVGPSVGGDGQGSDRGRIADKQRSVSIQCKVSDVFLGVQYHGTVSGFAGEWSILKSYLVGSVNDNNIPNC